jgi:hypothetical protein
MLDHPSSEEAHTHPSAEGRSGEGTASLVVHMQRQRQAQARHQPPRDGGDHSGEDQHENSKGK